MLITLSSLLIMLHILLMCCKTGSMLVALVETTGVASSSLLSRDVPQEKNYYLDICWISFEPNLIYNNVLHACFKNINVLDFFPNRYRQKA